MGMDDEVRRLDALRRAGDALREMRHKRGMKVREVEEASGGAVGRQDIVRLENAGISRPAMELLVAVGRFYGLTPNQMAELYGYWDPAEEQQVVQGSTYTPLARYLGSGESTAYT